MIGLIYSKEESFWISCKVITSNLLKSYRLMNAESLTEFDYNKRQNQFEIESIAKEIKNSGLKKLIFIDHHPSPINLLTALHEINLAKDVEIIIHVFGDFILPFPNHWLKLEKFFKSRQVKFICASDRQVSYIQQFLTETSTVYKSPFPVDFEQFNASEKSPNLRELFNIPKDKKVLGYSGRMSHQKNFTLLIDWLFNDFPENDFHFCFCGFVDDIGSPYLGYHQEQGELFQHIWHVIEKLPKEAQERIHYLGNLEFESLPLFYQLIDININIGTYNDEDYGMATAEALSSGTPSLLANWGGLSSFSYHDQSFCKLVDVILEQGKLKVDKVQFLSKLDQLYHQEYERNKISQSFKSYLSIEAVHQNLVQLIEAPAKSFESFSDLFLKLCTDWKEKPLPFKSENQRFPMTFSKLYQEIYECYFK